MDDFVEPQGGEREGLGASKAAEVVDEGRDAGGEVAVGVAVVHQQICAGRMEKEMGETLHGRTG